MSDVERWCVCGRILEPSRGWYCECEDDEQGDEP